MSSALPATLAQVTISDPVKVSGFGKAHLPPLDLNHCFAEYLRRLIPTSPAYVAARNAALAIAKDLRAELYRNARIDVAETDHIVAGSVGKRTAIAPINPVETGAAGPAKLLGRKFFQSVVPQIASVYSGAAIPIASYFASFREKFIEW